MIQHDDHLRHLRPARPGRRNTKGRHLFESMAGPRKRASPGAFGLVGRGSITSTMGNFRTASRDGWPTIRNASRFTSSAGPPERAGTAGKKITWQIRHFTRYLTIWLSIRGGFRADRGLTDGVG